MPFIFAQTSTTSPPPSGIWYPTILDPRGRGRDRPLSPPPCGSAHLLLGTILGARLGFLVAYTALAGFMVLLTTMRLFTAPPLNTLEGHDPGLVGHEGGAQPERHRRCPRRCATSRRTGRSSRRSRPRCWPCRRGRPSRHPAAGGEHPARPGTNQFASSAR